MSVCSSFRSAARILFPISKIGGILVALSGSLLGQPAGESLENVPEPSDTSVEKSTDSLGTERPIDRLGAIPMSDESADTIASAQVPWNAYDYLGDLLLLFPGVRVRDLGSVGQYQQVQLHGVDWRSIQVLVDGRPMNDPLTGTYNLNFISPEFIESIQLFDGPTGPLAGFNGAGGAINVATKNEESVRPVTKVQYSEGKYGQLYADGLFAHTLLQRLNFTAGFQRLTLDGRYPNSGYEAWNLRFKVRWNPSERFNLMLSEQYNNHNLDMNGGVDLLKTRPDDVFNEILATARNTDSYEKVNRNDLTATVGLRLFEDSAAVTTVSLYYSGILREYRDEENRTNPNGLYIRSDHRSSFSGLAVRQTLSLESALPVRIFFGGNLDRLQVEGSPNLGRRDEPQAGVFGEVQLAAPVIQFSAYGRLDRFLQRHLNSYGASASVSPVGWLTAVGGFSRSERSPTLQELYWKDSTVTRVENLETERHTVVQIGLMLHPAESLSGRISYTWRKIGNPILIRSVFGNYVFPSVDIRNGRERILRSCDGSLSYRLWRIELDAAGSYLLQKDDGKEVDLLSKWYLTGGVYFRGEVLGGTLDVKAGVRGKYIGRQTGGEFNPETLMYSERTGATIGPFQSVDVLIIAQVGDAFLHVLWENVSDEKYMITPGYPMLGRNVRFGINWKFFD